MVSEVTHVHHNGTATLIDQAFMSNVQLLQACSVVPPLGNSDHKGIHLQIQWKTKLNQVTAGRMVWRYAHVVRPRLEYASSLWDPHMSKDFTALESVQKFVSKIAIKHWTCEYQELLELVQYPLWQSAELN